MLTIRPIRTSDVAKIVEMVRGLAEFERLPVSVTEEDLLRDGFGASPKFRALIAEWKGTAAGYAFFFERYSTFAGRAGIFLEDLYVRDEFRGKGIGKALLAQVAAIAQKENYSGLRWDVLDWNTPAIDFYRKLGAEFLDEWKTVTLTGEAFKNVANGAETFAKK